MGHNIPKLLTRAFGESSKNTLITAMGDAFSQDGLHIDVHALLTDITNAPVKYRYLDGFSIDNIDEYEDKNTYAFIALLEKTVYKICDITHSQYAARKTPSNKTLNQQKQKEASALSASCTVPWLLYSYILTDK